LKKPALFTSLRTCAQILCFSHQSMAPIFKYEKTSLFTSLGTSPSVLKSPVLVIQAPVNDKGFWIT
jgi:hypothetical protein